MSSILRTKHVSMNEDNETFQSYFFLILDSFAVCAGNWKERFAVCGRLSKFQGCFQKITSATCSHSIKGFFLYNTLETVVIWLSSALHFPKFARAVCIKVCFAVLKLRAYRHHVVGFSRA